MNKRERRFFTAGFITAVLSILSVFQTTKFGLLIAGISALFTYIGLWYVLGIATREERNGWRGWKK